MDTAVSAGDSTVDHAAIGTEVLTDDAAAIHADALTDEPNVGASRDATAASLAAAVARVKTFSNEVARATGRPPSPSDTEQNGPSDEIFDSEDADVYELLEQLVAGDPWSFEGQQSPDEPPDSARADLAGDMGRVALESILRNVTFVVSTRVCGSFNQVRTRLGASMNVSGARRGTSLLLGRAAAGRHPPRG